MRSSPSSLVSAALALASACSSRPPEWPQLLADVRERYPDVAQVSVAELASAGEPAPLLLDARSSEEYAVSHLRGALSSPDESSALAALSGAQPEREIVVYCSVGMRSSALAEHLAARGFTHAKNLEGGIFAWANAGLPTYRGEGRVEERVSEVHPFDARWGSLLVAERRAKAGSH